MVETGSSNTCLVMKTTKDRLGTGFLSLLES